MQINLLAATGMKIPGDSVDGAMIEDETVVWLLMGIDGLLVTGNVVSCILWVVLSDDVDDLGNLVAGYWVELETLSTTKITKIFSVYSWAR